MGNMLILAQAALRSDVHKVMCTLLGVVVKLLSNAKVISCTDQLQLGVGLTFYGKIH